MPWDSLPEHIDTPEEWSGTDWDNKWQRWLLRLKGMFAYSACNKSNYWWANWRPLPFTLVAVRGKGEFRIEDDLTELTIPNKYCSSMGHRLKWSNTAGFYLSAIQYWTRWHFAIQWPFHVTCHLYWRQKNVPTFPTHPGDTVKGKMVYFRCGARRDADKVYWFPSVFLGLIWN